MNKKELAAKVAEKLGVSASAGNEALNAVLDSITDVLGDQEPVSLPGFGTFEVRNRAARTGRNPRTGEPVEIAASRYPAFKAGQRLKDAVS
jgi:DNA-binding protein HU-beta